MIEFASGSIHSSSASFKRGRSIISIAPNHVSLHKAELNHIDNYKDVENQHYQHLDAMNLDEKTQAVYNDLRMFQMQLKE